METAPIHPPSSILHSRRILVRGVNWLGDAVMTTPALLRLRERFPDAHITLLTPEKLRDLWLNHPALDAVVVFGAGAGPFSIGSWLRAPATGEAIQKNDETLRETRAPSVIE